METTYESGVSAQFVLVLATTSAKVPGKVFGDDAALGRLGLPVLVIPFLDILACVQTEASGGNGASVGIPVWRYAGIDGFLVYRRPA